MAVRPDTTQPTWLRLQEAAAYLGVSANTLRRAADAGRMPCRRTPGGHRRFLLSDIQEYLLATSARRSTARCAAPASPDQPQSTRQDAPSLAPRPGDATIPTPGPDTTLTSPSGHPAVHLSSAAAEHLMLLARSAASGLDLPLVLIAWRLDSDSALIVASHPPDSVPPLGLRAGDVAPLRLIPLAADILALGKPIICDDLTQPTEQLTTSIDYFHKVLGLTAAAGAPLMDGGRASGLLLCTTTTSPRSFSAADVAFLEQVAHQAAATCVSQESPSLTPPAPGSVRPHAPERAIPAATPRAHRIGPRLSGNPDEHLDAVAGLASRLLHAKSAAIVADAEGRLHTLATAPASGTTDRSAAPWSERALTILQRLRSRGYDRLPPTLPHDAVGTQLRILPLPFDGHTLAYLLYEDDGSGQSPSADLDALASLLGRAVHSHQESSRLTTRVTALEAVIDASVEDRALLDYSAILRATAKRLSELARAPVVDIYAVEGSVLRALVSYEKGGFDTGWQDVVLPLDRYPCSRRAARTGTIARATSLDDPVLTPEGRSSLEKWGYQSQVSAPLMASGRVLGLIEVSDYVPREIGRAHV